MTLEDKIIDYSLLAKAIDYYKNEGYTQIEVPWVVSSKASMVTAPRISSVFHSDIVNEHFIGSAEQGFIQLLLDDSDKIIPNQYHFAISPCFRRDIPSEIHSRWFMKVELFAYIPNMQGINVELDFLRAAFKLHELLFDVKLDKITTNSGFDLEYKGLEVGSYGIRKVNDKIFTYGTGLALPRAQLIMNHK